MVNQKPIPFLLLSATLCFLVDNHLLNLKTVAQLLPISTVANASAIQTYIVHVYHPYGSTDLLSYEDRENWYLSFLPNTTLDSGEPRLVHSYQHAITGFAAKLSHEELKAMESMDGFVLAHLSQKRPLLTTYTPEFLELDQYGNSIWESSTYGEGVIVGVLDTGIVPNHPSFSDSGILSPPGSKWRGCCQFQAPCNRWLPSICNKKLIGARTTGFVQSPIDKVGHGSHVAGIAVGNPVYNAEVLGQAKGTAVGMAPRAYLAVYKVCADYPGGENVCADDFILAGINQAIEDGVDVLSISIGGNSRSEPFYESGIIKGTFAAMEEGIFSSCCAGNEGRFPGDIDNDAPWILTVGASTIDRVIRVTVQLGNGVELYGESAYQPENYPSPWLPIEYPGGHTPTDAKKACTNGSLDDENVVGKLVLCGETNSARLDKGRTVKDAGGAGVVILNQEWNGFTTWAEAHVLPAAHLSHIDSLKIVNYAVTTPNPKARFIFDGTKFNARRSPAVTDFSSRGPSWRNGGIIKPDIVGPGSDILSAWSTDVGPDASGSSTSAFNFASGCSMATPHLAGIAAMLKSIYPRWSPAAIKSAIVTTAHTTDRQGQYIADEKSNSLEPATYFAMGAGQVNPSKAMDPGLVYDVGPDEYIRYLCSLGFTAAQLYAITRKQIQCSAIQKISAEQLNYPSIFVSLASSSEKTIRRTVTYVVEKGSLDYSLEMSVPEGTSVEVEPTVLHFSNVGEKQSFDVKFSKEGSSVNREYTEGYISWVSSKHIVRSPIVVELR